jgi:hypothetical protein
MGERASSVLTVEGRSVLKALLGGNTPELKVEPPSACSRDMVRDGIEAKPPSGVGERAWWLRQLVGLTPLSVWLDTSQSDPEPLVRAALNTEWGYDLWNGWFEATYREQEEDWTLALLRNPPRKPKADVGHLSQLLEVLSPTRRDEFLLDLLHKHPEPFTSTHPAFALLEHVRSPVGEPLAREVLRRLVLTFEATSRRPGKQRFDYTLWTFLSGLALIVPPSLSAEADSMLSKAVGNVEHLGPEVLRQLEILRFRHEMNQEFSR